MLKALLSFLGTVLVTVALSPIVLVGVIAGVLTLGYRVGYSLVIKGR